MKINTEPTAAQLANALRRDYLQSTASESCGWCGARDALREDRNGESICVDLEQCLGRRP